MGSYGHSSGGSVALARHPRLAALALIPVALGCFLLGRWTSPSTSSPGAAARLLGGETAVSKARTPANGAFWLVVGVIFQQEEDVATFERAFQPLADFVAKEEPGTLSYGYAKSDSDPKRILIFERYATKKDYLDVHKSSAPFLAFRPQLAALGAKIEGHSYYEGGVGFI